MGKEHKNENSHERGERKYLPHLIAWEITRSCNLNCVHCRAAAQYGPYENELTTEECKKLLDNIASFSNPIIILTGGEPLLRPDIFEIAQHGTNLGLRMVMAVNGVLITDEIAKKMKQVGIQRVSISIDGATKESHDNFRKVEGAFEGALRGIEILKKNGIEFQINTTITKRNLKELPKILNLAVELGAVAYHPFLLVPTGRGKELASEALSAKEYEEVLEWFEDMRDKVPLQFKPTCAPHYYRIIRQKAKEKGKTVDFKTYGLDAMTKGCLGGQGFAFISHQGIVQICGYMEVPCGNVREQDFKTIWETSPVFLKMRDLDHYHGKCGVCEYRKVCGGCRARAYELTGDYLAEEPLCTYTPTVCR
jgi:heme b synthase